MNDNIALDDLEIYQLAMQIGETVWSMVDKWNAFAKATIGEQLVRSADSIAANIAEGYGRYFYKDRKQFCYFSRGSLMETKAWLKKAANRKLINSDEHEEMLQQLKTLHFKLNSFIKKLKQNATTQTPST